MFLPKRGLDVKEFILIASSLTQGDLSVFQVVFKD